MTATGSAAKAPGPGTGAGLGIRTGSGSGSADAAVLVTRPAGPDDPLVARLEASGVRVHAVPTVLTQPVPPGGALDRAVSELAATDWVLLTSVAAIAALREAMARAGVLPTASQARPRFGVVGAATARALERTGIPVAVTSVDGTAVGLVPALEAVEALRGRRILLPRASAAAPDLPAALRAVGADVREVIAYQTVEGPPASGPALLDALADPGLRAVVVASGSAVRGVVGLCRLAGGTVADRLAAMPFVSIGPSTSAEVGRLGLWLAAEAATPAVDALADAVLALLHSAGQPGSAPRLEVSR